MSDAEIIDRLRTILGDIAPDLDLAAVAPDADLRNDIGLDSMDFLNFVIAAHKHLGVNVPEADYGKVTSLSKFARYIEALAAGHPG
jgi:acyl carrier protein